MKNAIASFINDHPFLSYMLAGTIVTSATKMVTTIVRGYPTNTSTMHLTSSDSDEAEVVDEPAASE